MLQSPLFDLSVDVSLGLTFWLISCFVPFRRFATRPQVAWDIVTFIAVFCFALSADVFLDEMYDWVADTDSFDQWNAIVVSRPAYGLFVVNVIVADFLAYWAHRLLHTRALWSVHAWHHSSRFLYWVSGLRGSPLHVLVLFAADTIAAFLVPTPDVVTLVVAAMVLNAANQHLIHSNIRLPFSRQLEFVFVTPRFHFVHHSARPERANTNFGFIFSVWDRLFGTCTDPATVPADDRLGLDYEISPWRLLVGLPAPRDRRGPPRPEAPAEQLTRQ